MVAKLKKVMVFKVYRKIYILKNEYKSVVFFMMIFIPYNSVEKMTTHKYNFTITQLHINTIIHKHITYNFSNTQTHKNINILIRHSVKEM